MPILMPVNAGWRQRQQVSLSAGWRVWRLHYRITGRSSTELIQTLAGLALLGTISGSLYQALNNEAERDAAIVTFLMTASGVTILGMGSAFWGLVLGGVCYAVFSRARRA